MIEYVSEKKYLNSKVYKRKNRKKFTDAFAFSNLFDILIITAFSS